jgi:hypothetical protein
MPTFRIRYRQQGGGTQVFSDDRIAPNQALAEKALYAIHGTRPAFKSLQVVGVERIGDDGKATPQEPA